MPNFLGTSTSFAQKFATPIAKGQLPSASASNIADGISKLKVLHQQVLPFILRREKYQVLPELPATTLTVVRVPMSGIQESIYRDFCSGKEGIRSLDAFGNALENPASMSADVLKSLLFLRLLCTHPSLVLSKSQRKERPVSWFTLGASGKMLALAELLREAGLYEDDITGADNDTSLLYCDDESDEQDAYSSVLETPERFVGTLASTSTTFGKIRPNNPSKCLVFAQFTKSLDAVEEFLFKAHMPSLRYVRLDGTVAPDKRMKIVEVFDRDPSIRVMLLTTRVGGLGLNLTVASTVIFLESDFNPFADIQAMDRTRRIGQTKVVNVYRITTKDSIEEKILVLQEKKVQVSEAIVNTDNSTLYSMGTDRLFDVFTLRGSDTAGEEDTTRLDYDLEGLVEQCSDDYKSLSVSQFTGSFVNR
jgi:TATA-binding protein-associated factor